MFELLALPRTSKCALQYCAQQFNAAVGMDQSGVSSNIDGQHPCTCTRVCNAWAHKCHAQCACSVLKASKAELGAGGNARRL
mmetsp:Transcript_742/g.1847  ORF Transcript_742/g.1847 Transcript_742/m.1847 type:complete len:82 (-) Transcript_742:42-287(-)